MEFAFLLFRVCCRSHLSLLIYSTFIASILSHIRRLVGSS